MSDLFSNARRAVVAGCIALFIGSSLTIIATTQAQAPTTTPSVPPTTQSVEAPGKKVVTPSGLTVITVQDGTDAVVQKDDLVIVEYTGKLLTGKVFDSSREPGRQPIQVHVGAGEVIKGWDEGLIGMKFMEKRQLIVPAELAYGKNEKPGIPPNSTLVFDMQLIGIARMPAK